MTEFKRRECPVTGRCLAGPGSAGYDPIRKYSISVWMTGTYCFETFSGSVDMLPNTTLQVLDDSEYSALLLVSAELPVSKFYQCLARMVW
jgi:hypothetical protein